MQGPLTGFTADDLLRHERALRRLAFVLVHDRDEADDLVQQTWIATLRHPPEANRPIRPWLFEIVRNLVRSGHRTAPRREHRESEFVGLLSSELPSPETTLERREIQKLIADLVLGLEEPLRATVMHRYYEGLSAADVARAQGIPPGTVRRRLKTALDRVRAELDRRYRGDRRAWTFLLLPAAGASETGRPRAREAGSKMATWRAAALFLPLVAGGAFMLTQRAGSTGNSDGQGLSTAAAGSVVPARKAIPQWAGPVQDSEGSELASARAPGVAHQPKGLVDFDFEDGALPADFASGQVMAGPARAGNRFAVAGQVDLTPGRPPRLRVDWYPPQSPVVYSRTLAVSFDYWLGAGVRAATVSFGTEGRVRVDTRVLDRNLDFKLRDLPEQWMHAEVPLVDFLPNSGIRAGEPLTPVGERHRRLSFTALFKTGSASSASFFIDNVKIVDYGLQALPRADVAPAMSEPR